MISRSSNKVLALLVAVATAALSLGCDGVGGVGIASGIPYGVGSSTPLGVGTVWGGGPVVY